MGTTYSSIRGMNMIKTASTTCLIAMLIFFSIGIAVAATMRVVQYPTDGVNDANLQSALDNAVADSNSELSVFKNQQELAKGFANANSFASHSASFQGFQNYNMFTVSAGVMTGFQAPTTDPSFYNPDNVENDIREDGDIYAGFAAGVSLNAGLHARFIATGLYLNLILGRMELGSERDTYKYKNTILGLGLNYGVFMPRTIVPLILRWNGISFGTGIIYQKNKVTFQVELDSVTQNVAPGVDMSLDPTVNLAFDIATYTVPLEMVTAIRLFSFLNLSAGAGIDVIYGSADLDVVSVGTVDVSGTTLIQKGIVEVDGSTRGVSPSRYRPKIMAGLGFSIMMVKLEVPVIYYPEAGAAIGFTAGVVF